MKQVLCSCCDKLLMEVPQDTGAGTLAAMLIQAEFIPKNLILYVNENRWEQFCSKECKDMFFEWLKLPPGKVEEVKAWADKCRAEAPAFAATELKEVLQKLQSS